MIARRAELATLPDPNEAAAARPRAVSRAEPRQPEPAGHDSAARDVARYVGSLAGEMAAMARREGMTTLAHLLDMSRLEARELERRYAMRG